MNLSPIILFVYNRPLHTRQVLDALKLNELVAESTLYIYADGAKAGASADTLKKIEETRNVISTVNWCREVFIIEREQNYGLQQSIITGVTEVVNKHGKVIVLEDDIVTSEFFLSYMNDALQLYQNEEQVLSIGSFNFFATDSKVSDTFFVPIPDCWGWATWKNRWHLFEPDGQLLLDKLRQQNLITKFNLEGAYNFENMLIGQINGTVSSWAVRWQALSYLQNKLNLYPKYSVTKNIGFDASGTNGGADIYSSLIKLPAKSIVVNKLPLVQDKSIEKKMIAGYLKINRPGWLSGVRDKLKKLKLR